MDELMNKKLVEEIEGSGYKMYFTPLVDDSSPLDYMDFETEKEKLEYCRQLDSGEIVRCLVKIHVELNEIEIGCAFLGNYESDDYEDFLKGSGEYEWLKEEAIEEADKWILSIKDTSKLVLANHHTEFLRNLLKDNFNEPEIKL